MTILSPNGVQTIFDLETKTLTRIMDNKARVVDLTKMKNLTIGELARMSNMDNESFKLMEELQK